MRSVGDYPSLKSFLGDLFLLKNYKGDYLREIAQGEKYGVWGIPCLYFKTKKEAVAMYSDIKREPRALKKQKK